MYNILELKDKSLEDLKVIAQEMGIKKIDASEKDDLVYKILDQQAIDIAGKKVAAQAETNAAKKKKSTTKAAKSKTPVKKTETETIVAVTVSAEQEPIVEKKTTKGRKPKAEKTVESTVENNKSDISEPIAVEETIQKEPEPLKTKKAKFSHPALKEQVELPVPENDEVAVIEKTAETESIEKPKARKVFKKETSEQQQENVLKDEKKESASEISKLTDKPAAEVPVKEKIQYEMPLPMQSETHLETFFPRSERQRFVPRNQQQRYSNNNLNNQSKDIQQTVQQPERVNNETKVAEKPYEFEGILTGNGVLEMMPDGYGFFALF